MTGGFNGNFEKWFAKKEDGHKVKLDPIPDHREMAPVTPRKKRDLSKPTKPVAVPAIKKPKPEQPILSLERLWQEILRLKNSKVEMGEFYKLQRKLGISAESMADGTQVSKTLDKNAPKSMIKKISGNTLNPLLGAAIAEVAAKDFVAKSGSSGSLRAA